MWPWLVYKVLSVRRESVFVSCCHRLDGRLLSTVSAFARDCICRRVGTCWWWFVDRISVFFVLYQAGANRHHCFRLLLSGQRYWSHCWLKQLWQWAATIHSMSSVWWQSIWLSLWRYIVWRMQGIFPLSVSVLMALPFTTLANLCTSSNRSSVILISYNESEQIHPSP